MYSPFWCGPPPARCDICCRRIVTAFIDGRTARGSWVSMCPNCHLVFGAGLGAGHGQLYVRAVDGRWPQFTEAET